MFWLKFLILTMWRVSALLTHRPIFNYFWLPKSNGTKSKGHTKGHFYFYGGRFCCYVSTFMFVASMASAV